MVQEVKGPEPLDPKELEELDTPQGLKVLQQSLPDKQKEYNPDPFEVYEEAYIPPEDTYADPYATLATEDPYALEVDDDPYESIDTEDPYALDVEGDPYDDLASGYTADSGILDEDPDAEWKPQTFEEYFQQEVESDKPINWTGFVDNSFIRHGYEWARSALDDDYVPENSIKGREIAIEEINRQINEIGPVRLLDYQNVRKAKDLWQQKYKLMYLNKMDELAMQGDMPSISEIAEAVYDDPGTFGKQIVQEIINKPELLFVPQFAAVRAGAAATKAAETIGATARAAKVMQVSAQASGAYAGGVTLGTLDRMAAEHTSVGQADLLKSLEQSQVDGVLGMVLYGSGKVMSKTVDRANAHFKAAQEARNKAGNVLSSTEVNAVRGLDQADLEMSVRDPMTETYIDDSGNVYTFNIRETVDTKQLTDDISELEVMAGRFADDKQALDAIDAELTAKKAELQKLRVDDAEFEPMKFRIQELEELKESKVKREELMDKIINATSRDTAESINFVTIKDADGVDHVLRRLTPEVLDEQIVKIPHMVDATYSPQGPTAAMNKLQGALSDFFLSSTAQLSRLKGLSPTAGKLIDLVDPRSGTKGRSYLETITEKTHYKQGRWQVDSEDIAKTLSQGQREALRKHMRGVEKSEDPKVLEAAQFYTKTLKEAREYARSVGINMEEIPGYLPRYYNQKLLQENPEMAAEMVKRLSELTDADGNPKFDLEYLAKSVQGIQQNIQKTKDGTGRLEVGGDIHARGNRVWKSVPDSILDDFLEEDLIGGIDRYLSNLAKQVEVARVFGPKGSKVDEMISQIAKEVEENSGGTRLLSGSAEDMSGEAGAIKRLYQLASGTYGNDLGVKPYTDGILAFQTVTKLPMVTITSALEPASMLFRLEGSSGLKALVKAYTPTKIRQLFKNEDGTGMTIDQIHREAKEVGLIHEAALKERLEAMVGEGLEGLPAKVSNKALKVFMLHQWTEHTRAVAYEAARADILKMAKAITVNPLGKQTATRKRRLAELGIPPEEVAKWIKEGADIGSPVYEKIKKGSARFANTMIANPDKFNKGTWMSSNNPIARLTSQFKSFGSTFYNTVGKETLDEISKKWNEGNKTAAMRQASSLMMVTGAMSYWTIYKNDLIFSQGEQPFGEDEGAEVATRMITGAAGFVVPFGHVAASPLAGKQTAIGTLTGSSAGTLERVTRFLQSTVKGEPKPKQLLGEVPVVKKLAEAGGDDGEPKVQ